MPLAVAMRTSMPSLRGMPATPTPAPMPMGPAAPTPAARPMELRPLLTATSTPTSKLASMALARATVATVVTAPTARVGAVVGDVGLAEPGAMLGASTSCGNHVNSFQNEFGASFLRMPIAYCMPSVAPSTYDAFSPTAAAPTQDLRTRRQPHISGFAAQARDDGPPARAQARDLEHSLVAGATTSHLRVHKVRRATVRPAAGERAPARGSALLQACDVACRLHRATGSG
jgi:hypothetical protein